MESNKIFVWKAKLFMKKGSTIKLQILINLLGNMLSVKLKISKNEQKISKNIAQEFSVIKISFISIYILV